MCPHVRTDRQRRVKDNLIKRDRQTDRRLNDYKFNEYRKDCEKYLNALNRQNRYIISWMLHQIFMYSNKVIPRRPRWLKNDTSFSIHPLYSIPSPHTWWPINEVHFSNLNWRHIFFCQYIHVFYIHYRQTLKI